MNYPLVRISQGRAGEVLQCVRLRTSLRSKDGWFRKRRSDDCFIYYRHVMGRLSDPLLSLARLLFVCMLAASHLAWAQPPGSELGLPAAMPSRARAESGQVVALGRRLFFDVRLSRNGEVSCASCHQPDRAFADGRRVAVGIRGQKGTRNTPSIINAALHETQFWDGRRPSLEEQAADPFVNPIEHGLPDHAALLALIRSNRRYAQDFADAFGVTPSSISMKEVTRALAGFVSSLASGNSPFDRYMYANERSALSPAAERGLELFRGRAQCAACHKIGQQSATFTDNQFHGVGVGLEDVAPKLAAIASRVARTSMDDIGPLVSQDAEVSALGRFLVTRNPADIGKFRTPTLRNVAHTAPYMHDGSVPTLQDAVDRELYYRGQALGRPLVLTPAERRDLVYFLESLTSSRLPQ